VGGKGVTVYKNIFSLWFLAGIKLNHLYLLISLNDLMVPLLFINKGDYYLNSKD